jgi:hypothetical protein
MSLGHLNGVEFLLGWRFSCSFFLFAQLPTQARPTNKLVFHTANILSWNRLGTFDSIMSGLDKPPELSSAGRTCLHGTVNSWPVQIYPVPTSKSYSTNNTSRLSTLPQFQEQHHHVLPHFHPCRLPPSHAVQLRHLLHPRIPHLPSTKHPERKRQESVLPSTQYE